MSGEEEVAADADRAGWLPPFLIWASVAAVLLVVSAVVHRRGDIDPQTFPLVPFDGDGVLGGWCRYDCGWYTFIAEEGYSHFEGSQSPVAFFPGYPLAMRAVGRPIGDVTLGGVFVTLACGLGSMVLFWRWCTARLTRPAALTAVALFALYPYGWYLYGAVYGDALFLLATLGAFALLERDQPVLAGIVAIAATATRAVGIAVVVGLVLLVLERRGAFVGQRRGGLPKRVDLRVLRRTDAGVLLGVGGLVGWCGYLWHRFGDPFLFSSVQEYWGQPSSPRTWFKIDFLATLFRGDDRLYAWGLLVQGLLTVTALAGTWFVARRFGRAYAGYTAVLVGLPALGSQDFQGLGRYLIGAFPLFALAGEALAERPAARRVVLPVCGFALIAGTAMFANGQYLS